MNSLSFVGWLRISILMVVCATLPIANAADEYAAAAGEKRRTALVIGNASYATEPLVNPIRDAQLIATRLRELGFDVQLRVDLGAGEFRAVLRRFWARANEADGDAIFYYAGHGVGLDGRNFLLPVDVDLTSAAQIELKGIDLKESLGVRPLATRRLNRVVILDACRDDPSRKAIVRGRASGFSEVGAASTLISFSTSVGARAFDGPASTNSFFTKHLAQEIMRENTDITSMFSEVRARVNAETQGRQVPVEFNSLFNRVVLRPKTDSREPEPAASDEERAIRAALRGATDGRATLDIDLHRNAREALHRALARLDSQEKLQEEALQAQRRADEEKKAADARRLALEAEARTLELAAAERAETARRLASEKAEAERIELAARERAQVAQLERDRVEAERLAVAERQRVNALAKAQAVARAEEARNARVAAEQSRLQRAEMEAIETRLRASEQARREADAKAVAMASDVKVVAAEASQLERDLQGALMRTETKSPTRTAKKDTDGNLLVRGVKLPADLRVLPPAVDTPARCGQFSGGWGGGRWAEVRSVEVWVETVNSDCSMRIVYALGGTSITNGRANFQRVSASVADSGEVRFRLASGSAITMRTNSASALELSLLDSQGGRYQVELDRLVHDPSLDTGEYAFERRDDGAAATTEIRVTNLWKTLPISIPGVRTVTAIEADSMLRDNTNAIVIDVLGETSERFALPNALFLPDFGKVKFVRAERYAAEEAITARTGGDKNRLIVVYERNTRYGWLGYHAALRLVGMGYSNVVWLRGGLDAWHDAGLALARG